MCKQAMKMLRTDLTGEGRIDILDRVKAYRGGEYMLSVKRTKINTCTDKDILER